jgi:type VI secretion system Hcp family effector
MAGGETDCFMGFSKEGKAETHSGKAPAIIGETQDAYERKWVKSNANLSSQAPLNDSIQIRSYDFGFSTDFHWTEEREHRDEQGVHGHYPEFQPLKVTKGFDRASPKLLEAVYYAARYKEVQLWQRRAGATQQRAGGYYFWVVLSDVTVNSVNWTTSENSPYPEETITLGYRTIYVDYMPQLSTGALNESENESGRVWTGDLSLVSGHGLENKSKEEDKDKDKHKAKAKGSLGNLSDADLEKKILAILRRNNVPVRA